MTWTDCQLNEGKMRAMGGGRSFATSVVRGMGLVVEYNNIAPNKSLEIASHIPSKGLLAEYNKIGSSKSLEVASRIPSKAADKVSKDTSADATRVCNVS
jgi:hypothetical protein